MCASKTCIIEQTIKRANKTTARERTRDEVRKRDMFSIHDRTHHSAGVRARARKQMGAIGKCAMRPPSAHAEFVRSKLRFTLLRMLSSLNLLGVRISWVQCIQTPHTHTTITNIYMLGHERTFCNISPKWSPQQLCMQSAASQPYPLTPPSPHPRAFRF